MPMRAPLRRAVLAFHIAVSVGWIGAVLAFLVLDLATVFRHDAPTVRACYIAMNLVTQWAIVPVAFASFFSGLWVALGTKWGLFRHYWVIISLAFTAAAIVVLLVQVPTIAHRASMATDSAVADEIVLAQGNLLLHSIGGLVVLLFIMALNIYKPRGVTRYGWHKATNEGE